MANRPKGYGLTAEVTRKQEQKYDIIAEQEAVDWINSVLGGTELGDAYGKDAVQEKLKDGIILCKLMNTLQPGAIKKIHPANSNSFRHMENISNFLKAVEEYGCLRGDLFQVVYLRENQNMCAVIQTLHALGRKAQCNGWNGTQLGPKESTKNERNFTPEQLLQGRIAGIS